MSHQVTCPSCGYPLVSSPEARGALYCHRCQRWYEAPVPPGLAYGQPQPPDTMARLIPTRNPNALIAYYLGVFSLLPCIGFFLAVPALILGIKGLMYVKRCPEVPGVVHAWVGIVMGAIFTTVWGAAIVILGVGMLSAR